MENNFNKLKTKGVVDETRFEDLANAISKAVLEMRYLSKDNIFTLVKAQMVIFYRKQHIGKLGLKIRNLEDNIADIRQKSKEHNVRMTNEREFWMEKLKSFITKNEFEKCYDELTKQRLETNNWGLGFKEPKDQ